MSESPEAGLDPLRARLRALGLRATAPRLAVLAVLCAQRRPLAHDEVMTRLPSGGFDRASVFRVLADLAEAGLLRRMDLGDRVWRYEIEEACATRDRAHAHFLCGDCGVATCLPPLDLGALLGVLPEGVARGRVLEITGRCGGCLAS
jgi:Fur family ferric uptake transcriptional regulator